MKKELTPTEECPEELGAPELLQEIAKGGHWTTDRIQDEADWCNLAQMASTGLVSTGQYYRRASTNIRAVDNVERESGARLYCDQRNSSWALQVRGPMKLRNGREGRDFVVATATLGREQLAALRDAIDRFLGDEDQPDAADETKVGRMS